MDYIYRTFFPTLDQEMIPQSFQGSGRLLNDYAGIS